MPFFTFPTSFRNANAQAYEPGFLDLSAGTGASGNLFIAASNAPPHSSHPALGHLILLVFEAVLEVVCVSLPGYIIARQGMFDSEQQKFLANLNVALFTPCLIFTKLASQLTASKLADLAVIPVIFVVQTIVSYCCSVSVSWLFGFKKRPRNFIIAMGVFGNSNSLPISLVLSLSQTIKGLHWDKVPGDNDEEVGARGILYLLIFQQLGQLVRWSWGYHVLLAPAEKYEEEDTPSSSEIEEGMGGYRDDPGSDEQRHLLDQQEDPSEESPDGTLVGGADNSPIKVRSTVGSRPESEYDSGDRTPISKQQYTSSLSSTTSSGAGRSKPQKAMDASATPTNGNLLQNDGADEHITSFPRILSTASPSDDKEPGVFLRRFRQLQNCLKRVAEGVKNSIRGGLSRFFQLLPLSVQRLLTKLASITVRFLLGLWEFMNPPLWAMLAAIIVASVPSLQSLFFSPGSFVANSATSAIRQSGGVAVPLILVVLGANLARNTLPHDPDRTAESDRHDTKLLIAALVSRMLLPIIIMAPSLALAAKYVPVSILDDPIFVIVCFLIVGAPSALQLAQICQINGVYESVMSKLLFQSYVIWYVLLPQ
ncbi:MAG: hypothetical protein M1825_000230 [Sarcosagium campestre]|nr:MAG: hypothetical protein M1825_000230 [Sarcosagium campestre]